MAAVKVYDIEGNEVETLELNDSVFGVEINEHLMHLAVVGQLANSRQGTQSAKTRSEVSGAVEESHGDRKEQVMQDRVQQGLRSGQAAELYSHQSQEIIQLR